MDYKELSKNFANAIGTYTGSPTFGTSFFDQWRNGQAGLNALDGVQANGTTLKQGQIDALESAARSMKGNAIAGGVMAGLNGVTNIFGNAMQAAQIQDTTHIQNQLDDLSRVGAYNYNNYEQLANDYSMTSLTPDIDYDDIRGMNLGQKISNVGSSALSGAASGMQIAGPWGAAAGAVIGAGSSLVGILSGDRKARTEENFLNAKADMASNMAQNNLSAAQERLSNHFNREGVVNAVAKGGKINRNQSIKEYADKVLRKPRRRDYSCGGRITKHYGEGGLTVRIRK